MRPRAEVTALASDAAPPRWWVELTMLAVGYVLYALTRDLAPAHRQEAFAHAAAIRDLEGRLHIGVERYANHWLAAHPAVQTVADYYYATAHFAVVLAVLLWLYWRHPTIYRRARTILVTATLAALAVFWWYPVAPPRFLPGYVDSVVVGHTWGSWGSGGAAALANQYAAMPSLHTVWATWAAGVVAVAAGRTAIRIGIAAYPLLTIAVIVATANHYLLDAVGGLATIAAATMAVHLVSRPARIRIELPARTMAPADIRPAADVAVADIGRADIGVPDEIGAADRREQHAHGLAQGR